MARGAAGFADACATCPLRSECTNATGGRIIKISVHEAALARGRACQAGSAWRADCRALVGEVRSRYRPNQVVARVVLGDREALAVVPLLADRPTLDGHATAYVCEHFACQHPVTEPEALAAQLG